MKVLLNAINVLLVIIIIFNIYCNFLLFFRCSSLYRQTKDQRLTRDAMKKYLRERGDMVSVTEQYVDILYTSPSPHRPYLAHKAVRAFVVQSGFQL